MSGQEVIGTLLNLQFQLGAQSRAPKATGSYWHTVDSDGIPGLGFTAPTCLLVLLL